MRRSVLVTLAVLGGVLSLITSAGLFAALSDTAHTGTNEVSTRELPSSADLQIATATVAFGTGASCGTFSDDLATPLITLTDQTPGFDSGEGYWYCLRNVGSQTVHVTANADKFTDVETACTGDEASFDATCGQADQGELGNIIRASFFGEDCATTSTQDPPATGVLLRDTVETGVDFGTLGPNQTRCFTSSIFMSQATPAQRQAAQSDQLTWRFVFTGSV